MTTTHQPNNILVTGGAGFIGSNYIHMLLCDDPAINIINLDKLTYAGTLDNLQNLPDPTRHHFVKGDINDADLVRTLLKKYAIDTIVHFAAESHVDRSIAAPDAFILTNIMGTFTLLEAARHHQCRFHHVSTDEVYGSLGPDDAPFTEDTPYMPNSPYSASKASSDHLVRAYGHTYGMWVTISNCSNNYGPRQHQEKLIPTIMRACINQTPIPLYGNGCNIRDWLYVDDHCRAVDLIVRRGVSGRTYNIGANNEWSNIEIAKYIARCMDKLHPRGQPYESLIEYVTDRPGHDWRYAINSERICAELGWKAGVSFAEGIYSTICQKSI